MAVTKIWKVVKRMDHVISYAKDENKTKIEFNQKYEMLVDDLQNVIDYARNSDKTEKVGFAKKDIYIVVKQLQDSDGKIKRLFELYDSDTNKFAETDKDGRLKYDKEITDELVKMKQLLQKQNEEQGTNFEIAGLDKNGELEAYMQMMDHEILSVTAEQKKELDSKNKNPKKQGLENKVDEEAKESMNQKEQKTQEIAEDLGIKPEDIYQMTQVKDDSFLRSEGITNGNELCAIKTRDGSLKMVVKDSEGKFEESPDFRDSSNESGYTTYVTNDHNNMQETITHGTTYFAKDPNKRISAKISFVKPVIYNAHSLTTTAKIK